MEVSVTVNVATPLASVTFGTSAGVIVEFPVPWVRVTVLPGTGTLPAPSRVTVTVDVSPPSATAVDGEATAVDSDGEGVVGAVGNDPSPGFSPRSSALASTLKGWENTWGA